MALRVPKVDAQDAAPLAAVVAAPRQPAEPAEMRQGRTDNLAKLLAATKDLPAAERARIQMQFLAYPAAWSADKWMNDGPSQPA